MASQDRWPLPICIFAAMLATMPWSHAAPSATGDQSLDIVVTGKRFVPPKIDYRLGPRRLDYCGPHDKAQDPALVHRICGFVADCVFNGQKASSQLTACVETRIAREESRGG